MLREYGRSLEVLEEARGKLAAHQPRRMPALYAREAEVYARIGDEDAITRLIAAFKASPYYDAEHYAFTGGQGREVPLAVTRPVARGSDSLTVTTMEMYRQRARFAPGRPFPDFAAVDLRGHPVKLADLRGKVVLLDFWLRGWEAWRRNLPVLQAAYDDYAPRNFEIIGFNLERQADDLPDFLRQNKIRWPVVAGNTDLPRRLGIFGEATNFLLDRNGEIIARDLSGADLTAAIRDALGVP
jgi:thiol-disulfide isomerase/thioredoxin